MLWGHVVEVKRYWLPRRRHIHADRNVSCRRVKLFHSHYCLHFSKQHYMRWMSHRRGISQSQGQDYMQQYTMCWSDTEFLM